MLAVPGDLCPPLDVAFILDDSASISDSQWADQLQFVEDVIAHLDMANDGYRVGVVAFGKYPRLVFPLEKHTTTSSAIADVRAMVHQPHATGTSAAMAFTAQEVFTQFGDRPYRSNVAILMTDGPVGDKGAYPYVNMTTSAKLLRDEARVSSWEFAA